MRRDFRSGRGLFLAARTFAHFTVDLACAFLVTGVFLPAVGGGAEALVGVIAYNVLAFATQPLLGALCDRFPRLRGAAWGCFGVLAALLCAAVPLRRTALVLCALGNALFHAGAGRDVLLHSSGRMKWGGVFVSSGALGVPLGMLAGQAMGLRSVVLIPGFLLLTALSISLCLVFCKGSGGLEPPVSCSFDAASGRSFGWVLLLALLSVMVRSFVGGAVPMPWKTGGLVVAAGAASCLGKACGGFFADRFGARRTGVLALLLSLPLLCLGNEALWLSLMGLFLFNCTMPVSLGTVASKLPNSPGLAFGLTAQLLIVGMLPLYLWELPAGAALPVSAGLILLSALCIGLSSNNKRSSEEGTI